MENHNPHARETDAARQGSVVFDKPWKRRVFLLSVVGTAAVAAILLIVFV